MFILNYTFFLFWGEYILNYTVMHERFNESISMRSRCPTKNRTQIVRLNLDLCMVTSSKLHIWFFVKKKEESFIYGYLICIYLVAFLLFGLNCVILFYIEGFWFIFPSFYLSFFFLNKFLSLCWGLLKKIVFITLYWIPFISPSSIYANKVLVYKWSYGKRQQKE